MTTDPTDRGQSAEVVPLRAVDAHTEVRLDEDKPPGPSYVDLTSGQPQRKAIIPEHWRSWETPASTSAWPRPVTPTAPPTTASAPRRTSPRPWPSQCGGSWCWPGGAAAMTLRAR
jgi:hypothetical protein